MHVGMVREHWTWGVRKYSRLRFSIVHSTSKHLLCLLLVAQGPHGHKIQRSRSWRKAARERCTGWGVQEGNDQVQGQVHLHSLGITHSHILIYIYIYIIYIYIRATPGLCPSVAASRVPIPNQMLLQLYIQVGRSTKVLGNIKIPRPLNFTFNWENQQMYWGILKSHPRQILHSIGKINKGIREF